MESTKKANERFAIVMDRLEKFLDDHEKPPAATVITITEEPPHPEGLDEVLEEMATSGLINIEHMRRIINAIKPVLEENAKLKAGL
jgi:hypothetical protein